MPAPAPAASGKGQCIVHGLELFSSLLTLASAAAITFFCGGFASAWPFCGLGIFTGAVGLILSVLLLAAPKVPKLHSNLRGLVELLLSVAWAAFFVATGALAAQLLSMGVCSFAGAAASISSALTSGLSSMLPRRMLLQTTASSFTGSFSSMLGSASSSITGAITSAVNTVSQFAGLGALIATGQNPAALCGSAAALTAGGFSGFVFFVTGAVLAGVRDLKQGHGVWAPASARAKAAHQNGAMAG